jgi:cytochrome b
MNTASATSATSGTPASSTAAPPRSAAAAPRQRRVIDVPTRIFHWLFALSFLGAYLTSEGEKLRALHVTLGYTMAGLLVFRLVWGLLGPRHAGLAPMLRKLKGWSDWLDRLMAARDARSAPWQQGHNLAMTTAIVALLAVVVPLTASGWLSYNDLGGHLLEEVHEFFGNGLLLVVLAHLALIAAGSWLRRRNLAAPMFTGRSAGVGPDLIQRSWALIGAALLVAVLGFWAWQWHDSPNGLITKAGVQALLSGEHGEDD